MTNEERARRFNRALIAFDRLTLTILKGHLLIEEELSAILDKRVCNPKAISEAKLTFFQKLKLVEATLSNRLSPEELRIIEKLNSLRNEVAHQFDSPRVQKLILELVTLMKLKPEKNASIKNTQDYKIAIVDMALIKTYGGLLELREDLRSRKSL